MKRIFKYPLAIAKENTIPMPEDAVILSTQVQGGIPCIWAIGDPSLNLKLHQFCMFQTGEEVDLDLNKVKFLGTFLLHGGTFVAHLFEVPYQ